jgi:hypothetical protein
VIEDPLRKNLSERTGKHLCVRCLREVEADQYFRNDHLCDTCAAEGDYPLASTPDPKRKKNAR